MRWRTRYVWAFQVRTEKGRLIAHAGSIEQAEVQATSGKCRDVWKWDGKQYRHYRNYSK
jgi:hypothetical protein